MVAYLDNIVKRNARYLRRAALCIGFDAEDIAGACWEALLVHWNQHKSFDRCHPYKIARRAGIDFIRHYGGRDEHVRRINVSLLDGVMDSWDRMVTDPAEAIDMARWINNLKRGIPLIRNAGRLW